MNENDAPTGSGQGQSGDESLFHLIFERAASGMCCTDAAGTFTIVNDRFCEIAGRSRDQLLGKTVADITHPDDVEEDRRLKSLLIAGEIEDYSFEKRYLGADGSERWVNLTLSTLPFTFSDGSRLVGVVQDISEQKQTEHDLWRSQAYLSGNNAVFESIAQGNSLRDTLELLVNVIETEAPYSLGSVLILDSDGVTLRLGAAPSLPAAYNDAIDGIASGEGVGSCGTAVARRERVVVEDIATDPLWKNFRDLALSHGLRACWSSPILSSRGTVLGAFAIYRREPHAPGPDEIQFLDSCAALASIAIERKQADVARHAAEEHLKKAFAASPLATLSIGLDARVRMWNDAASRLFGFSEADGPGFVLPVFAERASGAVTSLRERVLRGEIVRDAEVQHITRDGVALELVLHAAPIKSDDGQVSEVMVVLEDVSGRKERDRKLHELGIAIENAPDAVYITDKTGTILYLNPSVEYITGYSAPEMIGSNPRMFKSGLHNPAFYTRLWESIAGGGVWRGRVINKRKDGSLYPEEKTIAPVHDDSGTLTGFVSIGRDATAEAALETRLRETQKLEAIGALAGGIAHDFNNVLQTVFSYLDLASPIIQARAPEAAGDIEQVRRSAERAASLTRQLLAFSRKQVLELQPMDLNSAIGDFLKMIRSALPESIELSFEPAPSLPRVIADTHQIQQALLNLCMNSRDAMPDGGRLTIRTQPVEQSGSAPWLSSEGSAGSWASLVVSDTGIGMDEWTRTRIFEPFFTTKQGGRGIGLGLPMVYGTIRQHQGSIEVASVPGAGSTFTILLPAAEPESQAPVSTESTAAKGATSEMILIAEDEELIRRAMERVLTKAGYRVLSAADGEEALALFLAHQGQISAAVLDVVMPKFDGREVMVRMRDVNPDVPVLFCTGYSADTVHTRFVLENGFDLLQKPFEMKLLLSKVRSCLDRRK